jgi:hypothetical protein
MYITDHLHSTAASCQVKDRCKHFFIYVERPDNFIFRTVGVFVPRKSYTHLQRVLY